MASRVCWQCGVLAHHTGVGGDSTKRNFDGDIWQRPMRCDQCGAMSIAIVDDDTTVPKVADAIATIEAGEYVRWVPERYSGKNYPDVPDHIASAASEAHTCFSAQAYRGAIILARAVVEATAKDKGAGKGTLAAKIEKLHKDGHVRELIKDTADEIRHLGNDMAHGDFIDPASQAEAEDVLAFMAEVLDEVYQAPARVNARKAIRQARKAGTTP